MSSYSPSDAKIKYAFEFDIPNLIKAVEKRRGLYDPSSPAYRDRCAKKKLWDEVCVEVCSPAEWDGLTKTAKGEFALEVQKKWGNLRNCYRRELLIRSRIKSGQLRKKMKRTYYHFKALNFLRPYTDGKYPTKVVHSDEESVEFETETLEDPLDDESDGAGDNRSPSPNTSQNYDQITMDLEDVKAEESYFPVNNAYKRNCIANIEGNQHANRKRHLEVELNGSRSKDVRNNTQKDEEISDDGDDAFFQSLLPTLRELTSDQKLLLRIEIIKTILNFKKSLQ